MFHKLRLNPTDPDEVQLYRGHICDPDMWEWFFFGRLETKEEREAVSLNAEMWGLDSDLWTVLEENARLTDENETHVRAYSAWALNRDPDIAILRVATDHMLRDADYREAVL